MNMDMNPCMNAEIWAQLADEHILFCCLTHSWFASAPRSIKSETHTSKLWRRFESEAIRGQEGKMHQLWMWSDTAPLLAVGAFQGCHVSRHTDIWVKKAKKKLSKLYKKFVQGISGTSKTTSQTSSKTSSKTTQDNLGIRRQSRREGISKSAIHVPPTNVPHRPHLHLRVPWHGPMGMDGMDLLWIRY